jgi:hypothetical protein
MVDNNNKMLGYEPAKLRDILSLQNWVENNSCLARDETAYLTYCEDLISVASSRDGMAEQLEAWIEDIVARCGRVFCKVGLPRLKLQSSELNIPRSFVEIYREIHIYMFSPGLNWHV